MQEVWCINCQSQAWNGHCTRESDQGSSQKLNRSSDQFHRKVKEALEKVGFNVNMEKSFWGPSHMVEWHGFHIDLVNKPGSSSQAGSKSDRKNNVNVSCLRFSDPSLMNNRISWCYHLALTELEIELPCISFNEQHIWPRPSAVRVWVVRLVLAG